MRSSTVYLLVLIALSSPFVIACGEATPSGTGPDAGTHANTDSGTPSVTDGGTGFDCTEVPPTSLEDLFRAYFASSSPTGCVAGCHGVGAGLLKFSTPDEFWAATVNVRARGSKLDLVEPGDPESSFLYKKLLPSASSRMPQGGPYLNDGALAEVAGWICAGAPQ